MLVLPFSHIQMTTKLNRAEAEQRLAEQVEPRRFIGGAFRGDHKYFEGEIENGRFKINRVFRYKNSAFNPTMVGEFRETAENTTIDIVVRFDNAALIMLITVFSVVLIISLCFTVQFASITNFLQSVFLSLRIPFLIFVVDIFFFNIGVAQVQEYLRNIFDEK
jgi:hypothetical protein